MKGLEWLIGSSAGLISGLSLRKWRKEPSVTKMKYDRKKEDFYQTGRIQHKDIQTTKKKMRMEAKKNLMTERGTSIMENQNINQQQTATKRGNKKLPIAILTGALIGGAFILIKDPSQRKRLKEGTRSTKDAVSNYASDVKEDPSAKKDDLVTRARNVASIVSEAATTVQEVFNNQGKEITEKAKDIKEEAKDIKEESEEIVNTAKDAGEDLQNVGDKAKEAKSELTEEKSEEENEKTPQEKVVEVNPQR
ncbi:hypothetical protein SAMN04487936_10715 [Halobacillus dabanensis]|uniref:Gas vesicle protein n=1 Tax=Halobacillus dabanensis TaxID=240302 RepID=A0A1I3WKI7_HALDA|nr:hypothetical protein [Halobacillus dabanensis]SFK08204.1 hypothetical protein SAMN04487936_10715 [Halobacillus dabanensis]